MIKFLTFRVTSRPTEFKPSLFFTLLNYWGTEITQGLHFPLFLGFRISSPVHIKDPTINTVVLAKGSVQSYKSFFTDQ